MQSCQQRFSLHPNDITLLTLQFIIFFSSWLTKCSVATKYLKHCLCFSICISVSTRDFYMCFVSLLSYPASQIWQNNSLFLKHNLKADIFLCETDVRDTINYKEVMKQYGLGPNGAIVTSLNLFATKFDQVISLVAKASEKHKLCIIDTPGQIEVFTWSASGNIITETLASTFPTVVVYVMDTVRSVNPVTFMSNMLYACSILYKTKLPFIVAMNKVSISLIAGDWLQYFYHYNVGKRISLLRTDLAKHLPKINSEEMDQRPIYYIFSPKHI